MASRKDMSDAGDNDYQGTLFSSGDEPACNHDAGLQSGLPILGEIACTVAIERLPKGLRVSARDYSNRPWWGFVASRGILEQPHAAIAVYSALREALDPHLDTATRDETSVLSVVTAANRVLDDLERLVRAMRHSIACKANAKPSQTTIAQAAGIYRGATDALSMLMQDLNVQASTSVDAADEYGPTV